MEADFAHYPGIHTSFQAELFPPFSAGRSFVQRRRLDGQNALILMQLEYFYSTFLEPSIFLTAANGKNLIQGIRLSIANISRILVKLT